MRKNYQFEIIVIQSDHFCQVLLWALIPSDNFLSSTFIGFTFPIPLKKLLVSSHWVKAYSPERALHLSIDKLDPHAIVPLNLAIQFKHSTNK